MKSSNRLLVGFGIAIGILVLVTVGLVLARGGESSPPLPENTPEGTVQRYLLALKDGDFTRAQSYILIEDTGKGFPPSPGLRPPPFYSGDRPGWKATLGKTTISGGQATVEVIIDRFRGPGGPFDNPVYTNRVFFSLKKQGEKWLITAPVDAYFIY